MINYDEYRVEAMKGRQQVGNAVPDNRGGQPTFKPQRMSPQEIHESQSQIDEFSPENAEYQQGGGNSGKIYTAGA